MIYVHRAHRNKLDESLEGFRYGDSGRGQHGSRPLVPSTTGIYIRISGFTWPYGRSPKTMSPLTGKYSFFGSGCAYLLVLNVGIFWIDRTRQPPEKSTLITGVQKEADGKSRTPVVPVNGESMAPVADGYSVGM